MGPKEAALMWAEGLPGWLGGLLFRGFFLTGEEEEKGCGSCVSSKMIVLLLGCMLGVPFMKINTDFKVVGFQESA